MGLTGCYGFMKYMLMFVNLIFWTFGLAAVVLAVWMLTDQTFIVSLTQEKHNYYAGLYILLAAGTLMLVVAFLGCCGAFRESQCMMVAFFSCLLVVVVAQIAAGAWLYTHSDYLKKLVERSVQNSVKNDYGEIESTTETLDAFQSKLKCCGAWDPRDWNGSKYSDRKKISDIGDRYTIPKSCCKEGTSADTCKDAVNLIVSGELHEAINKEGCIPKLLKEIKSNLDIVVGITIAVGILQLLGLIFSLVLCCAIGSSERYKA